MSLIEFPCAKRRYDFPLSISLATKWLRLRKLSGTRLKPLFHCLKTKQGLHWLVGGEICCLFYTKPVGLSLDPKRWRIIINNQSFVFQPSRVLVLFSGVRKIRDYGKLFFFIRRSVGLRRGVLSACCCCCFLLHNSEPKSPTPRQAHYIHHMKEGSEPTLA